MPNTLSTVLRSTMTRLLHTGAETRISSYHTSMVFYNDRLNTENEESASVWVSLRA